MSFMVSLLFCIFISFFFLFSHFLFSLFVLFLHVQFCKAHSRYCISQLVSLQRKFTVSCSLLQYSVHGFLSLYLYLSFPFSWCLHFPPCFSPKSFPSLWKASRPTYSGRTGRCTTLPYNACDLIVSNSVVFWTLAVIFPPFLHFSPIPLTVFLCLFLNYFPSSPVSPHLMVRLVLTCIFVLCVNDVLGWWLWCSTSVCTYGSIGEWGPTMSVLFKCKLEKDYKRNFWKWGPNETKLENFP